MQRCCGNSFFKNSVQEKDFGKQATSEPGVFCISIKNKEYIVIDINTYFNDSISKRDTAKHKKDKQRIHRDIAAIGWFKTANF